MRQLLFKRILASIIDYTIVAGYAGVLFLCTNIISLKFNLKLSENPMIGQLIGFLILTLPVITYSYLTEKSVWRGTIGKRLQKIIVLTDQSKISRSILLRNILKYLPWEIAHTGVHWIVYYSSNSIETPIWVWVILILPQIVSVMYFISIVSSKGESSIYDRISMTSLFEKI
ncbi:MAG: hypothetical protein HOP30_09265 [Cyclobacteriaceae bacterium]|nr:hypothetical protein [Cyclobacteriaceae bacterium]